MLNIDYNKDNKVMVTLTCGIKTMKAWNTFWKEEFTKYTINQKTKVMEFLKIGYTIPILKVLPDAEGMLIDTRFTGLVLNTGICADGKFHFLVMCIEDKKVYNICSTDKNKVEVLGIINSDEENFFRAIDIE